MRLKEFRQQSGMTQEQVARALGIPKKTYQNYEREVREADSTVLCSLADLYGTSLDELVGRMAIEPQANAAVVTEMQDELVGIFQSLDEEGKRFLLAIARCVGEFHA